MLPLEHGLVCLVDILTNLYKSYMLKDLSRILPDYYTFRCWSFL